MKNHWVETLIYPFLFLGKNAKTHVFYELLIVSIASVCFYCLVSPNLSAHVHTGLAFTVKINNQAKRYTY